MTSSFICNFSCTPLSGCGVNESSPNEIEIKFDNFISPLPVLDPLVQGVPEKLELGKEAVKQVKHNWILHHLNHSFSVPFCYYFSSILLNSDLALSQLLLFK